MKNSFNQQAIDVSLAENWTKKMFCLIAFPLFPFSFQLVLKHRQGKNHKMRIVVFVGSPVEADDKDVSWIYKLSFFILE